MTRDDLLVTSDRVLLLGARDERILLELANGIRDIVGHEYETLADAKERIRELDERVADLKAELSEAEDNLWGAERAASRDRERMTSVACAFAFDVGMGWKP